MTKEIRQAKSTIRAKRQNRIARQFWPSQANAARRTELQWFFRFTMKQSEAAGYTIAVKRREIRVMMRARCSNY